MFAVITDNTSSIRKAVQNMIWNSLCAVHNNCFAHTLQLCVEDGLKSQPEITAVIDKFRAIVSVFHHSTVLTESLKKAQDTLGIPEEKLVADVRTRWNSTCIMLRSAVALQHCTTAVDWLGTLQSSTANRRSRHHLRLTMTWRVD